MPVCYERRDRIIAMLKDDGPLTTREITDRFDPNMSDGTRHLIYNLLHTMEYEGFVKADYLCTGKAPGKCNLWSLTDKEYVHPSGRPKATGKTKYYSELIHKYIIDHPGCTTREISAAFGGFGAQGLKSVLQSYLTHGTIRCEKWFPTGLKWYSVSPDKPGIKAQRPDCPDNYVPPPPLAREFVGCRTGNPPQ